MVKLRRRQFILLPFLLAFVFQATQYARAPIQYSYYIVHSKNADIAVRSGNDCNPMGQALLQNSTTQDGLYELSLGCWGPGYQINYTDAFRIYNREVFDVRMISLNFSEGATGIEYLRIRVKNDTDGDGIGDHWITAWDGSSIILGTNHFIFLAGASNYGSDGGFTQVEIDLVISSTAIDLSNLAPEIRFSGQMWLWFTSTVF